MYKEEHRVLGYIVYLPTPFQLCGKWKLLQELNWLFSVWCIKDVCLAERGWGRGEGVGGFVFAQL